MRSLDAVKHPRGGRTGDIDQAGTLRGGQDRRLTEPNIGEAGMCCTGVSLKILSRSVR